MDQSTKTIPPQAQAWGPEQRQLQHQVLTRYRLENVVPSLQRLAMATGVSVSTVALFMNGNSTNPQLRDYIRRLIQDKAATYKEAAKLFELWETT